MAFALAEYLQIHDYNYDSVIKWVIKLDRMYCRYGNLSCDKDDQNLFTNDCMFVIPALWHKSINQVELIRPVITAGNSCQPPEATDVYKYTQWNSPEMLWSYPASWLECLLFLWCVEAGWIPSWKPLLCCLPNETLSLFSRQRLEKLSLQHLRLLL